MKDLGLWSDPEYLRRKQGRTVRHDRREVIPECIIEVREQSEY